MGKIPDDPPQTAPRGLCWLPGVIWARLGMWMGDPGSGPAHCLPMAWRGRWPRAWRTVHPAHRRTWTLSRGAGQPLPQSLRAAFCGHPQVTAPGASALCAREALGCSSGDTSGAGRTNLPARPRPLAGDEPCRAARPLQLGRWGAASSLAHLQTAGPAQPAGRSGLRGAQVLLTVVTTGCDPVSSGAQVVRCGEDGAHVSDGRPCGCVSL